jgi:CRISPR-associated endonuclease Csn1
MGLNTYQKLKETVVDFENEITVNKQKWEDVFNDRAYYECMYQNKLFTIKKNIAIAEKKIKYHHMVDKKCNRGLSKAGIYGTRKYDGGIYKIKKMEIRTKDGIDTFRKLVDGKTDRILMKKNDTITFQNILEIYKNYREAENPFVEYERETGQVIKKYARNGKGCIITKIKYLDKNFIFNANIATDFGSLIHETEEAIAHAIVDGVAIDYVALKNRFIIQTKCSFAVENS